MVNNLKKKMSQRQVMLSPVVYKTLISVGLGLLGFAGTFFTLSFKVGQFNLAFVWGMLFPMLITQAWGIKYGFLSLFVGLSIFHPFYLWGNEGLACFVSFGINIVWFILHGYGVEKRKKSEKSIYNIYFIEMFCIIIDMLMYFLLFPLAIKNNLLLGYKHAITDVSLSYIHVFYFKRIVQDFFILIACDVLLLLPSVKKLFLFKVKRESKHNGAILARILIIGVAFLFLSIIMEYFLPLKDKLPMPNKIIDDRDIVYFIILIMLCMLTGGITIRYLEKKQKAEELARRSERKQAKVQEEYKLIFDKMLEGMIISEFIYNEEGEAVDVVAVKANPAIEKQLGLKSKDIIGNAYISSFKGNKSKLKTLHDILKNDTPLQREVFTTNFNRYLLLNAFKINDKQIGIMFHDISEIKRLEENRKKAEQQLIKINQKLEQLVEERTKELTGTLTELEAFTHTVSHDLKSPLRAIDGYSTIILEDYKEVLQKEVVQMITNISNVSCDMIKLIDKVLLYSTTSKAKIQKEQVDIKEIFINVFNELKTICLNRNIEFNIKTAMPIVAADGILMRQVVYNILSNAVKFTRNKEIAVINVGCTQNSSKQIFYIEDNGTGFDMKYANKLFTMFERLHNREEYEGSGIGLAIVHKIIEKHGGRAWIESKLNEGTKMYFTLPISKVIKCIK